MKSYWRERAAPIIAKVIEENKDKDLKEVRKALFQAYPFGERQYHPYKVWLDECAKQLGTKKKTHWHLGRKKKIEPPDPNQMNLL
jgi:hypothetical protein